MKHLSLFALLLLAAAKVQAAPVSIAGIARNGTHKNAPIVGEVVQLIRASGDNGRTIVDTTRTDAQGKFRFPSRECSSHDLFFANINHGNYDYFVVAYDGAHTLKQFGIDPKPSNLEMLAFDTTTQANGAKLDFQVHHLAIKSTPKGLHVIERIVVENLSNLTYLGFGPRHISVLLNIPSIAKNIQLDPKITGAEMLQTKNGWGIAMPILPAAYNKQNLQNKIIFSYDVDWPSRLPWAKTVDLSREIAYPTKYFFVARETGEGEKEIKVDAPILGPEQSQQFSDPNNGSVQTRLVNSIGAPMGGGGPALAGGKMLEIKISRPVSSLFWGFAGLVGAMCLFVPVALVKPKRAERSRTGSVSSHTSARGAGEGDFLPLNGFALAPTLSPPARELVQRIADLDDAFEAKQIDEATYQGQRAQWKKQLIDSLASAPDDH